MRFAIDDKAILELGPGDVLDAVACEQAIGFSRNSDLYTFQFAIMQLSEHVQKTLWRNGKRFTVVSNNAIVRVLTHAEASVYNLNRFNNAIKKMRRCHRHLLAVDASQFTQDMRTEHVESIVRTSRVLTSMDTRKTLELTAHECRVPKRA